MNDLIKVEVIKEFWFEGNHFCTNEELIFSDTLIKEIGIEHFRIIKDLKNPPKDKMVRLSTQK